MHKKNKNNLKWFNPHRKFIFFICGFLTFITTPIIAVLIIFIKIMQKNNFNVNISILIFKKEIFTIYLSNLIIYGLLIFLIQWILIFIFAQFSGKIKNSNLISEASEKAFGRASWDINEYKTPLSLNEKKRNLQLFNFEKTFTKNFEEASYITKTEIWKNQVKFWGISVKEAVHTITIGSTGSGKTQRIIFPSAVINANLNFENKPCMVFSDPKGELFENLGYFLEKQGYEVLVLNLRDPMYSSSWNPLTNAYNFLIESINYVKNKVIKEIIYNKILFDDFIKKNPCFFHKEKFCLECRQFNEDKVINETDYLKSSNKYELVVAFKEKTIYQIDGFWTADENLAKEVINGERNKLKNLAYEEINDLAATLLNPGADDKNKQWYDGAQGIFKGVIFAMMEMIEEDIDSITEQQFNIVTVATHLANKDSLQNFFQKWSVGRETNQSVIAANKVLTSSSQSMGNFFSIVSTALALFEGNELRSLLCKNNINLFDFAILEKPKAIFMIVPDDRETKHPLASLFISQLYKANVYKASLNLAKYGKDQLDRDVIFYLDEFGNFPAIVNFATILTVSRGRRMFFNLVLQNFEQLETRYDAKIAETIKGNCLLTTYLKSPSSSTHEEISKMCGQTTIEIRSDTPNINPKTGAKTFSKHLQKAPLIEPSDIKLIFPVEKKEQNKYAIILYQESNPNLITFEYFYKMKKYFNFEVKDKRININKAINFEKDYFINLFKIEIKSKNKNQEELISDENLENIDFFDEDFEEKEDFSFKKVNNNFNKLDVENIDKILELKSQERNIRNDLYMLQLKPADQLSSIEKEQIKNLQKELKKILRNYNG